MPSVNKVIIIGNLGQAPEVKNLPSGSMVVNISVATTESWTDKQTGQKQESTEWHRVVFFNRLAEIASQYLRKGSQVYIEGRLQTRKWQDERGQDRYTTEVVAVEMQMLGGNRNGQAGLQDGGYQQQYQQQAPSGGGGNYQPPNHPGGGGPNSGQNFR